MFANIYINKAKQSVPFSIMSERCHMVLKKVTGDLGKVSDDLRKVSDNLGKVLDGP